MQLKRQSRLHILLTLKSPYICGKMATSHSFKLNYWIFWKLSSTYVHLWICLVKLDIYGHTLTVNNTRWPPCNLERDQTGGDFLFSLISQACYSTFFLFSYFFKPKQRQKPQRTSLFLTSLPTSHCFALIPKPIGSDRQCKFKKTHSFFSFIFFQSF